MKENILSCAMMSLAYPYRHATTSCFVVKPERGEPKLKKCLLPDCVKLTKHNGGYCSADHCKGHRAKMKGKS